MKKELCGLLTALLLVGCSNLMVRSTGKAVIMLRPSYGDGGYTSQADVPIYSKASINHLVLKLFTVNGGETAVLDGGGQVTKDIPKADLDSAIMIGNLQANKTYRIRSYAYKAAGTNPADLISDASSYVDVSVLTDDRPTMAGIPVKLIDRDFAGLATGSLSITPGGYTYPYGEGFSSLYNTVYRIESIAGGSPEGQSATTAMLICPQAVACDAAGNTYIADTHNRRVRKVTPDGKIHTIAGNGLEGFSGDGGPATLAKLSRPTFLAVAGNGTVYFTDADNQRIRKIATDGTISTVAGNGTSGFLGDGGPATAAKLKNPAGLALDNSGNLFIADTTNCRVRKVASDGTISTVAGNGGAGFAGDGGQATSTNVNYPTSVVLDGSGTLYIACNDRVRKVATNGTISTFAGTGTPGFSGDGEQATLAQVTASQLALASDNTLYITGNCRIRKVAPDGTITTVAGSGNNLYNGDGGLATAANVEATGLALDSSGNLLLADNNNNRVRKIAGGIITTIAGNGIQGYAGGYSGDGGQATSALIFAPGDIVVDNAGNKYFADSRNHRVRKIAPNGVITTIAGNGTSGFSGDGGPANAAKLNAPNHIALDTSGSLYIADAGNFRVRKIATDGTISTIAGSGTYGYGTPVDGEPATSAKLCDITGIALDSLGNLLIADADFNDTFAGRIRRVATNGTITTVVGNGNYGLAGDGGPATSATITYPQGVALDVSGNIYFADMDNQRIRKIGTDGTITTFLENSGYPNALTLDALANLYLGYSGQIKKVTNGVVTVIAGDGSTAYSTGNGGSGTLAKIHTPAGIAVDRVGVVYFTDWTNNDIRRLE